MSTTLMSVVRLSEAVRPEMADPLSLAVPVISTFFNKESCDLRIDEDLINSY